MNQKVEFIESYIKHGNGDYQWSDNHGELIRCKDCKHIGNMYKCPVFYSKEKQSDNWFCADGERREYVKPQAESATDWDGVECE